MGKQVNRYSLVYHYSNGDRKVFALDFENGDHREKFSLTELDAFTSGFSSEEELTRALNVVFGGYNDGHFNIEYKSGGALRSMEIVYNDLPFIRDLAKHNLRSSHVSKYEITEYMYKFLGEIEKDSQLLPYLVSHRYVNSYCMNAVSYYLMLKHSLESDVGSALFDAEVSLKKEFMRYKTIRGLEVGRRNYELKKQNIERDYNPSELTVLQRAKIEYELNHPTKINKKKVKKPKKNDVIDGQLPLFNPDDYTDGFKGKKL